MSEVMTSFQVDCCRRIGRNDGGAARIGQAELDALCASHEVLRQELEFERFKNTRCEDCGAVQNFIGKGLFECWKCTEIELRARIKALAEFFETRVDPVDPLTIVQNLHVVLKGTK